MDAFLDPLGAYTFNIDHNTSNSNINASIHSVYIVFVHSDRR